MPKAKGYKRRRLFAMPVEPIFDHPGYVALPVAGRGMLWSILEHYWKTECAPRPIDSDQLFAIARAHRSTWYVHKTAILKVFDDVAPALESRFRSSQAGRDALWESGKKGGFHSAARRATSRLPKTQSPLDPSAILPRTDPAQQTKPAPDDGRPRVRDAA